MFAPLWHTPVKVTLTILLLVAAYGWMSADDWEEELQQEQAQIELAQKAIEVPPEEPEPELKWNTVEPTPVPVNPFAQAKKTAKKAAVKTKKRVKKALKPRQ